MSIHELGYIFLTLIFGVEVLLFVQFLQERFVTCGDLLHLLCAVTVIFLLTVSQLAKIMFISLLNARSIGYAQLL